GRRCEARYARTVNLFTARAGGRSRAPGGTSPGQTGHASNSRAVSRSGKPAVRGQRRAGHYSAAGATEAAMATASSRESGTSRRSRRPPSVNSRKPPGEASFENHQPTPPAQETGSARSGILRPPSFSASERTAQASDGEPAGRGP